MRPHSEGLYGQMTRSVTGASSALGAADRLCRTCVELLEVDGAAISLVHGAAIRGTFGSSGATSRRLDELQFTFGEGPCLEAVASGKVVLLEDLDDPADARWPAYRAAARQSDVRAIFALPVEVGANHVGALDLYRHRSGPLGADALAGARIAAEMAALPLLDLLTAEVDWDSIARGVPFPQIATLERVEVNQATGMIIAALELDPVDALLRLRAHAFAHGQTASEVAYQIVDRRLGADLRD